MLANLMRTENRRQRLYENIETPFESSLLSDPEMDNWLKFLFLLNLVCYNCFLANLCGLFHMFAWNILNFCWAIADFRVLRPFKHPPLHTHTLLIAIALMNAWLSTYRIFWHMLPFKIQYSIRSHILVIYRHNSINFVL